MGGDAGAVQRLAGDLCSEREGVRAVAALGFAQRAWLPQVLPSSSLIRAGRYLTDKSYQFSVDVAAVGNASGRGYCREKTIFDMRTGKPRIIFHQDLTAYGWALGAEVRETLRQGRNDRA